MINLYYLNKYNKSCSYSGIVPHQTAVQEYFLLDIIASGSIDAFNGIANSLQPSILTTGIGGAHSSNIQESQTNSWWESHNSRGNPYVIIRRLSAAKPDWHNQETHPSERGHTFL